MSYNHDALRREIYEELKNNPLAPVKKLSEVLGVSQRTVQHIIGGADQQIRLLRQMFVLGRVNSLLLSNPHLTIKELSFSVGYKSQRSFARAVRRACGLSPMDLRRAIGQQTSQARFREGSPNQAP